MASIAAYALGVALLLGFVALPKGVLAQCGSTEEGTSGNPFPLTIGTEAQCVANSLPVPSPTAQQQSNTTPLGCGATQQREIWFVFTATGTTTVINLYNNSSSNVGFMVYEAPCAANMTLVGCAGYDLPAAYTIVRGAFSTVPGNTYYVRVSRRNSNILPNGLRICGWTWVRPPDYETCEASFESGNTDGWTCSYGFYDFELNFPNEVCLNPGGLNAPLVGGNGANQPWNGGNRHTVIGDKLYLDPRTNFNVPGVAPGGGDYSFRLGNNDYGCGVPGGSPCPSQAESVRFDLLVTPDNAGFTYMFAAVMFNPQHDETEQPRFEALVYGPDGEVADCGYFLFVAGSGLAQFINGPGSWQYTNWTEVGLDLTPYMGETVTLEFRVAGCYPAGSSTSCSCVNNVCNVQGITSGGITYNCTGVPSCTVNDPANNPNCTPVGSGTNSAGTHSAYAYIDAYCKPLAVESPSFCAGEASIEICAPPGYANYSWPAGQPGIQPPLDQQCVTINSPISGTVYTVNMELITGCPTTTTVELVGIPVTLTNDTVICAGQEVQLSVNVIDEDEDPPYTFEWSHGPTGPGPHPVSPSETTIYTVITTGGSGCGSAANVVVTVDNCLHTVTTTAGGTCPGGCVEISAAIANDDFPPYTITWSDGVPDGPGPHTVCPSSTTTYTVTVTDANGEAVTATATVEVYAPPAPSVQTTPVSCTGDADGSATVSVPSGSSPFEHVWNTTPPQAGSFATGLSSGTVSVTTTDANGCTATAEGLVTEPPPLGLEMSFTPANCGEQDGTATAAPTGGTAPYAFQWASPPGGADATISALSAGTYTVTVTDGNGCTITGSVTVTSPGAGELSVAGADASCAGAADGTATVTITNGEEPFTYAWNTLPPQTTATATGLAAGTYAVTVTEGNGCVGSISVTIQEPPAIAIVTSSTPATCGNDNGSATLDIGGGAAPYQVTWNTIPPQTGPTATGLAPGSWSAQVTDADGCTATATAQVADVPGPVAGFSVAAVCLGEPAVFINTSTGGTAWAWEMGDGATYAQQQVQHTYAAPGSYSVTLVVTDANGCSDNFTATVLVSPAPEAAFVAEPTSGCVPFTATFVNTAPLPGTTCQWLFGDGGLATDCAGAVHTYTQPGCYDVTLTVTVSGCTATLTVPDMVCADPLPIADFTVTPNPVSTTAPLVTYLNMSSGASSFAWTFPGGAPLVSDQRDPVVDYSGAEPGIYQACLLAASPAGCLDSLCRALTVLDDLRVHVPNAFTPNGDGINDVFLPILLGHDPDRFELLIFNRWGEQIYSTVDATKGWDGRSQGVDAQDGVYVWKLRVAASLGSKREEFTGHVTLLR